MTGLYSINDDLSVVEPDLSQGNHATVPAPQVHQPHQSVLDLKITDLLSFLHQYQANCPNLQMICPLFGVPLPYIDIKLDSSPESSARIELSLRLSEALVKHMLASRTASAKVS